MPQVFAAISYGIGYFGAGIGLSINAATALAGFITTGLQYAAVNFALNKALQLLSNRGKTGEGRGLEVSITDATASARILYGEVRTGGVNAIPPITSGDDNDILHQVLLIAAHEIESIEEYYFDTETLPTPTAVTGSANDGLISSGTYEDAAWVRAYLGTMTQNADYILDTAFTAWASTARARGFAYVALAYKWGKGKVYERGMPQATFLIRGAKLYDPRLDSTNGGSGSHRYNDPTTWEWSQNPALAWAHYRMGDFGYSNDPATEINWSTVAAAATICDASVDDKDGGSQARYTINGVLLNDVENLQDNEQKIIDCMLGHRTFVNGQWCIYAGAWTAPSWTIAREDWLSIDSIITISPFDQQGRYNSVHCFYIDKDRNWQRMECYPRTSSTYRDDDAGQALPIEIDQPMCTDESEAQRKAEFILRASRNGIKLVGHLPPRFHKMRTFDTVALTFDELGWSSKTFRIAASKLLEDGSIQVVLAEEQEADWADLDTADYDLPSTATVPTQNPMSASATTALTATSLAGTIAFAWTEPVVIPPGTRYRLMQAAGNSYGVSTPVWEGTALQTEITKTSTATYYYWLDSVSAVGSYKTYPGVNSGIPGYAKLVETDNVNPESVTRVTVTDTPASVSSFVSVSNFILTSMDLSGTYEITFSGLVQCTNFVSAEFITHSAIVTGGGSLTGGYRNVWLANSGQYFAINHQATYVTSGAGPWVVKASIVGGGAGNRLSGSEFVMRTTVIRR